MDEDICILDLLKLISTFLECFSFLQVANEQSAAKGRKRTTNDPSPIKAKVPKPATNEGEATTIETENVGNESTSVSTTSESRENGSVDQSESLSNDNLVDSDSNNLANMVGSVLKVKSFAKESNVAAASKDKTDEEGEPSGEDCEAALLIDEFCATMKNLVKAVKSKQVLTQITNHHTLFG